MADNSRSHISETFGTLGYEQKTIPSDVSDEEWSFVALT